MAREIGSQVQATNLEGKFGWTFDARNMVQTYADLLAFDATNYIRNGFPVAVFDADVTKRGIYICIDQTAISNAAAWFKVGGSIPFDSVTGDPYTNILLKNILDGKQDVANQLITQVTVSYADGNVTIAALAEANIRWMYAGSQYSVASPVVIAIPDAATDMYRTDLIYANTSNLMLRRAGVEDNTASISPTVQANEVYVTTVNIFGDSEVTVTQPDLTLYAKKADPNVFTAENTFKRAVKLDNTDGGGYDFYDDTVFRGSIKFDRITGEFKLLSRTDASVTYEWIVGDRNTKKMVFAGAVAGAIAINDDEYVTLAQLNDASIPLWDEDKVGGYDIGKSVFYGDDIDGYSLYYNTVTANDAEPSTVSSGWLLVNEGAFISRLGNQTKEGRLSIQNGSLQITPGAYLVQGMDGDTNQFIWYSKSGVGADGILRWNYWDSSSTPGDGDDWLRIDPTADSYEILKTLILSSVSSGDASTDQIAVIAADGSIKKLAADFIDSSIDDAIDAYDLLIKASVPSEGNNFLKLYNLIVGGFKETIVANIAARDAYNVTTLPQNVFVTDDGDGNWALYKATTTGVGATFIKISDPDLLNAVMSASAIKSAYESNANTNAFTDALLTKLNAITGTNTGDETAQTVGTIVAGATADTPASDDFWTFSKVSASNILKKITHTNLLAVLKTYFDTIYTSVVKATSSELNTGTDDAKFATALGLKNSNYSDRAWSKITGLLGGTNTTYTLSLTPTLASLVTGQPIIFKPNLTNAANPTINVDSTGAKALIGVDGAAIPASTLSTSLYYMAVYNGTAYQLLGLLNTNAILNQQASQQNANFWALMGRLDTSMGLGVAAASTFWLGIAANTSTKASLLLTPSTTDYTGSTAGSIWNNTGELKFIDGTIVNRLLKAYSNSLLAAGVSGSYTLRTDQYGDIGTGDQEVEFEVLDSDVITAITGATYTNNRATITPASSKIMYTGQVYDDGTTYTYMAIRDNYVRRW